MPCANPDGTLTAAGEALLRVLEQPRTQEQIAERIGLPLYRVRASLREAVGAGLVEVEAGRYVASSKGLALVAA